MQLSDEHTLNMTKSYVYLIFYFSVVKIMILHWLHCYFYTDILLAYGSPPMPNLKIDGLNLFSKMRVVARTVGKWL